MSMLFFRITGMLSAIYFGFLAAIIHSGSKTLDSLHVGLLAGGGVCLALASLGWTVKVACDKVLEEIKKLNKQGS